jgi:HD-like signal output (HDOD) protein/CheY-like chemotaxis protein
MDLVLLVDASPVCRELLAKVLETQGFSVACARTCAEAFRSLGLAVPRLVILEPATDGNGIRFLKSLRQDMRWKDLPVIVLTDLSDKLTVVQVAQCGVRDYILKSRFSLAELLTRIQRHVRPGTEAPKARAPTPAETSAPAASSHLPQPPHPPRPQPVRIPPPTPAETPVSRAPVAVRRLTRDQTVERIEASTQTKTLPGVVAEVISLVNSPRGAISDVAQALKRDPVLSARILHLANSAAFISQKPRVSSIDEAVRNIGVAGVRNMVLAVGIYESFSSEAGDPLEALRLWQHFFGVASIMERLVPPSDAAPAGTAHLVGLCHDLAELALRQQFPTEYAAALELARRTRRTLPQVGAEVFGVPFPELVAMLLGKFGLPPVIIVPIEEFFERALSKQQVGLGSVLSRALRIANVYAHGLTLAPTADAPITPISKAEYRGAFGNTPVVQLDDQALWSEALMMVNMLSGAPAAVARKLSQPLIAPSRSRVLYVRHTSYCSFDPLAALIRFAGEVEIRDAIPRSSAELGDCEALIVAASRQDNPLLAQQDAGSLSQLLAERPLPFLYLSGVDPQALSALPPGSCHKLPVSLSLLAEYFSKRRAQTPVHTPAPNTDSAASLVYST